MREGQLELAELVAEMINLLVELEGYLALPDPADITRIREVLPRLDQLRCLIN